MSLEYIQYPVTFALAFLFILLERFAPRYDKGFLRKHIYRDVFYFIFNFIIFWIIAAPVINKIQLGIFKYAADYPKIDSLLRNGLFEGTPFWQQFVVMIVVYDLLQYGVHNLLHRAPFLWEFHRVHHSLRYLDWVANWRFHWMELIVYGGLMYFPLAAMFGFTDQTLLCFVIIIGVSNFWGFFNHSNLRWKIGKLTYLVNNPAMHIWHHNYHKPYPRNLAIIFSAWDWIFGTAYMPDDNPKKLGYPGMKKLPDSLFWQLVLPIRRKWFVKEKKEGKDEK